MHLLKKTIKNIKLIEHAQSQKVMEELSSSLPDVSSLGALTKLLANYAGIIGDSALSVPKKCTVVACADHGVAEMKISAYPIETTVQMTKNYLISKGAVANALANFSHSDMIVVDMGIAAPMDNIDGLIDRKIAFGTKNCARQAAMTKEEAIRALHTGIEIADTYAKKGYRCFLPGEMGIANTTSSAAIVATICGLSPEQATGRGTNISDERLKHKIEVVRQALAVNKPDPHDGIDILAKVGGFELGCIAGIILGAAANRAFVVLDGFNTGAAALIATRLCPCAKHYLMGSHLAAEPAHKQTLETLGLHPYMDMKFRLGEATGSSIAVNLLDAAIKIYRQVTDEQKKTPPIKSTPFGNPETTARSLVQYMEKIHPYDKETMEKCQLYIDNLTKPIHSLGVLEEIAVKVSGINGQEKPSRQKKTLVTFTPVPGDVTNALALHADASLTYLEDIPDDALSAFVYGISAAHGIAYFGEKMIGFATADPRLIDAINENTEQLNTFKGIEDIKKLPPKLASLTGLIIGAAHERCVIVTDGLISQAAAYLALKLAPSAKDYLFIPEYMTHPRGQTLKRIIGIPSCLDLKITNDLGCISALGMRLIDAAMHMVNDMKTFEDAAVATANDGPGSTRQKK